MNYIGIDVHKQSFVATIMDEKGNVLDKQKVSTDRVPVARYLKSIQRFQPCSAVMEACYNWSYLYDLLKSEVHDICLAHPLKTRLIAETRIKTDSIDSESLAHLLRVDCIPKAYAPLPKTRQMKSLLRYRASLVQARTRIKNRIHALLDQYHIENPKLRSLTDIFGVTGMRLLHETTLPEHDNYVLHAQLELLEKYANDIKDADTLIRRLVKEDEICGYLKTIPGVGYILTLLLRYEIDDINRFASAKRLCSYAGLVPATYSSGRRTYQGRITK